MKIEVLDRGGGCTVIKCNSPIDIVVCNKIRQIIDALIMQCDFRCCDLGPSNSVEHLDK